MGWFNGDPIFRFAIAFPLTVSHHAYFGILSFEEYSDEESPRAAPNCQPGILWTEHKICQLGPVAVDSNTEGAAGCIFVLEGELQCEP